MASRTKFKTLIIIDLETTGLIYDQPKITELAMIAVNITTLEEMKSNEELPRVMNKFVKFFDPVKLLRPEAEAVELTGLNNRMLMDYAPFNRETVIGMEAFLSDLQKPMCFVAHNGNLFDFPILFDEIRSALSTPAFHANSNNNNNSECISETCTNIPNDTIPIASLTTKDSSMQTITTSDDHNQTSLTSIDCADSLIFFREMHRLLNDKDIVQYPKENIPLESPITIEKNECNNNALVEPIDLSSSSAISINSNSSSRLGYVEIPIKYIPSPDPARQQVSMKLSKIYEREFSQNTSHLKAHRAEDDCLMLLAILKRYLSDWLEWIEMNHQPLSNFSSLPLVTAKKSSPNNVVKTKRPLKF